MKGLDYKWLEALFSIMEQKGFEKAADSLFISQSAISQRIKQLENFVAQPVLIREHPIRLTPLGKKLIGFYKKVMMLEEEILPEISNTHTTSPITVSIASNADSLATWLLPALSPVIKSQNVALDIRVITESRALEKLKSGEVSGALCVESEPMSGCCSALLGRVDYRCVANAEFIQRYFADGVSTETLQNAPAVCFDQYDTMHKEFLWENFGLTSQNIVYHSVGSSEAFIKLALMGAAYCMIPSLQIKNELKNGTLIDITPDLTYSYDIYWHHWQLESGILKQVTKAIVSHTRKRLAS